MSYKVTKRNEAYRYEAPGHYDVLTTRLHDPTDVNEGTIVNGLSHFLPGGGAEAAVSKFEMIYYIISGEMTVTMYDENDTDAGRDWGQEEKGTAEDEMAEWHHRLEAHEFGWTPGVGDGQGGLAYCNSWGHKESDTTEQLN